MTLLNSVGGVGGVVAKRGWRGSIKIWRGSKKRREWRGSKFWSKVGLNYFVKKVLLKVSQNLQESTCAGVFC